MSAIAWSLKVHENGRKSTLKIATKSLKKAKAGKPYSQKVKAKGGWVQEEKEELDPGEEEEEPGYEFEIVDGGLPDGLDLAADGSITGTPTSLSFEATGAGDTDFLTNRTGFVVLHGVAVVVIVPVLLRVAWRDWHLHNATR